MGIAGSLLALTLHVRPRIWDKSLAIRHLHLGKSLLVYHFRLFDDTVQIENERGD